MLGVPVDQILEVVRRQNADRRHRHDRDQGERIGDPGRRRADSRPSNLTAPAVQRQRPHAHPGRRRRHQARLHTTRARSRCASSGKPVIGLGVVMAAGRQRADARQGARRRRWPTIEARPAGRHHRASRRQPARGGRQVVRGVHLTRCRGAGHRAGRVVHQPGLCAPASSWRCRCRWCWPSPSSA